MTNSLRRVARAVIYFCLTIILTLMALTVSPSFAADEYYWSYGAEGQQLWGDALDGGWWQVKYVVDKGSAERPNPQGHYEWKMVSFIGNDFKTSNAHFYAFNQTVRPKVFDVYLNSLLSKVSVQSLLIDNTKNPFYSGHDWNFFGDYAFEGQWNISATSVVIQGGEYNTRFTTVFDDLGLSTGRLAIRDYNTLTVKNGSLWASEVVLAGYLDLQRASFRAATVTGQYNHSLNISAQGHNVIDIGTITNVSARFYNTYGNSSGVDYPFATNFVNSTIQIGLPDALAWVELVGPGLTGRNNLIINSGSRFSLAGDKAFTAPSGAGYTLWLSGSGTFRLTDDLLAAERLYGTDFTGAYDLNSHHLTLEAALMGSPSVFYSGGQLTLRHVDQMTLKGAGLFQAGPTEELKLNLSQTRQGLLTLADTGLSQGGSLVLESGEGEFILSGGQYNYPLGVTNQNKLTLSNQASLIGDLTNYGVLTIASPVSLTGDLLTPMNPTLNSSLILKARLTITGDSRFINETQTVGSPYYGQAIKSTLDYQGGKLTVSGTLALDDLLFQAELSHRGFYVLAEYHTLTGRLGNAAQDYSNVSSLVTVGGQTNQPAWLVYDNANQRILLLAGDGQTILFRTNANSGSWHDHQGGWESLAVSDSGIVSSPRNWDNSHGVVAVFDSAHGTPGLVTINSAIQALALVFMDNNWIIQSGSGNKLFLEPLPTVDGPRLVLNSQAPDTDPTFATSPRINALMVSNPNDQLYKTGPGTLVLNPGFYDSSSYNTAPREVVIQEGRLVLATDQALASATSGSPYYSQVTIAPNATLRLAFSANLLNQLIGSGSLEIASGSSVVSSISQPEYSGTILVEPGNSGPTVLTVQRFEALGLAGDIDLQAGNPDPSKLILDYANLAKVFPRRITGAGLVEIAAGSLVRLGSGHTYAGGTTINNNAILSAETPGPGLAIDSLGSGSVTFNGSAILNLVGLGGILNNELIDPLTTAKLALDAGDYTLVDNNVRSDSTNFLGEISLAPGGSLTLSADLNQGLSATPPFSLSGSGELILDGPNVTFSGLDGPLGSSKTSSFSGLTTIMDESVLELTATYGQSGLAAINLDHDGSLLRLNMTSPTTFPNPLSGSGTVQLLNNQTYAFSGDNSLFAGALDVGGGTLTINANNNLGTATLKLDGGTLDFASNSLSLDNVLSLGAGGATIDNLNSITLGGPIIDSGSSSPYGTLTKTQAGILTLTNSASLYQGATSVTAGELRLADGGLLGGGAVNVASGATLSGYGRISGDTAIASGGTLKVAGALTLDHNLTINVGTTNNLEFSHGGWLSVAGALNINGLSSTNKLTVNLDSLGVYVLAKYGTTNLATGLTPFTGAYVINYDGSDITGNANYRKELFNYVAQKEVLLITLPTGQKVEFWDQDSGGVWDPAGALNWNTHYISANGQKEVWASDSKVAVFGTSGLTPGEIKVTGSVSAAGLFFLSDGYSLTGAAIQLLDLDPYDGSNSYALISGQAGEIYIEASLTGQGVGLRKSGPATLILNAANSYDGPTLVSSGVLSLGDLRAAGLNNLITVDSGAVLRLAYDETGSGFRPTVAGQGLLEITGRVLLDTANTHTGGTRLANGELWLKENDALGFGDFIFNDGLLRLANNLNLTKAISLEGLNNQVFLAAGEEATLSGAITGGGLTKIGAGSLTISGSNSLIGLVDLAEGQLIAANDSALGYGTVKMASGVTLGFSGARTLKNDINLEGSAYIEATGSDFGTLNGVIYGPGDLLKTGPGTLTLGGVNAFTGVTAVKEGTLFLSPGARISSQLAIYGGATFNSGGNVTPLELLEAYYPATYIGDLSVAKGTIKFHLPIDATPLGAPILSVNGSVDLTDSYVALDLGGRKRAEYLGHVLNLIATTGDLRGRPINQVAAGRIGLTRAYEADLYTDPNHLYAAVTYLGASPESKALVEGYFAGAALVNLGADLAAGSGLTAAVKAVAAGLNPGLGLAAFGAVSAGNLRYRTGSHVDTRSVSLMVGLAKGASDLNAALAATTFGGFVEYGNGAYDTYNSFNNVGSIKGEGDLYYLGGGLLGRLDFTPTGPGHLYLEVTGRLGRVYNEYASSDLRDAVTGVKGDYETSALYYGAHIGAGYVWDFSPKGSLDLYGKYFWTRQEGAKVTLKNGDPVTFKDVNSNRLRLGGRLAYALNESFTPYLGAAYEREMDGEAKATTYGYPIKAPTVRGDTGIGELGLTYAPSVNSPFSLEVGAQAYVGQRAGLTGSLKLKWDF